MTSENDGVSVPRGRRRGIRRMTSVPIAIVSALAVALGFAHPAEAAASPAPKRLAKAKASPGEPVARIAAAAATAAPVPVEVIVADGDTVSGIAARFGVPTAELLAANGLGWSSLIFPGQRLALPGATAHPAPEPGAPIAKHVVVHGDTLSGIASRYGVGLEAVLSVNGLDRSSLIFPGQAVVLPGAADAAPPPAAAEAPPPAVASSGDLTDEMRSTVRTIVDVGRSLGVPEQGIVVALAAAAQESGLRNLDHGDRDSLGVFQQRPSQGWGTVQQVLDPVRAATVFFGGADAGGGLRVLGLLDIPGWQSMSVTEAAQAVQQSAFPDHYAAWEEPARRWLAELG